MLELVALADDGWAAVRQGDNLRLFRPPYRDEDLHPIKSRHLGYILNHEDFEPIEGIAFRDWRTLRDYLESRLVAMLGSPDRSAWQRVIERADARQAARHLERIRDALKRGQVKSVDPDLVALLERKARGES